MVRSPFSKSGHTPGPNPCSVCGLTHPDPSPVALGVGDDPEPDPFDPFGPAQEAVYDLTDLVREVRDILSAEFRHGPTLVDTRTVALSDGRDHIITTNQAFDHVFITQADPSDVSGTGNAVYVMWAGDGDRFPVRRFVVQLGPADFYGHDFELPVPVNTLHIRRLIDNANDTAPANIPALLFVLTTKEVKL